MNTTTALTPATRPKQCPDCLAIFPDTFEFFHRRNATRTTTYCKKCASTRAKAHHQANREKHLAAMTEYRDDHRTELRAYWRDYNRAHADKRSEQSKSLYQRKKLERSATAHAYYQAHRELYVRKARLWQAKNPEKARAYYQKKRLRRRGASLDAQGAAYVRTLAMDPCCYCGQFADQMEIDHITPISAGGTSAWDNLTSACRSCNAAKSGKRLLDYLQRRIAE